MKATIRFLLFVSSGLMFDLMAIVRCLLLLASWVIFVHVAEAAPITVLTSFPKEVTEVYKKAFEKKFQGTQIEVVSMSSSAALNYVKQAPAGLRPDVFWASAPDVFEVMSRQKLLERAPEVRNPAVPPKIGKYPMNDPEGMYFGQALSGYGIMLNRRYLEEKSLPKPSEWADLTKPVYAGHVAMSSPARSGTTHLTVETILQGEGWNHGWSQLLQIAGNCSAIAPTSHDVPESVNRGQAGVGVVIDFFGLAGKYGGYPVDFVYPKMTAVVPANIGLIAGARNSFDGKRFIAFALSMEGQELLLDPKISRIPVLPYEDLLGRVPGTYPNIFGVARKAQVQFNSELAQARYALVSSLFEQMITVNLRELQAAIKAIQEAEQKMTSKQNAQAASLLLRARELAFTPLVSAAIASDRDSVKQLLAKGAAAAAGKADPALQAQWNAQAKMNYAKAVELAQSAVALVR